MPAPKEATIVGHILKWLNAQPGVKAIKLHGDAFSVAGTPDILCVSRAEDGTEWVCPIMLEVKRPGNTPTPIQEKQLDEWKRVGAVVGVVHSVDEAKELLRAHGIALD